MTPDLFATEEGRERFTTIHAPALAIFSHEDDSGRVSGDDPQTSASAVRQTLENRNRELQAAAFERQVPSAHLVRIPHATHYVFQSNEADVLREINTFIATLPPAK